MPELHHEPKEEPRAQHQTIDDWLNTPRFRESLSRILPKHLTSERFAAVAMRQFRLIPGLLKCTPESVLSAFMEAAGLGLEIGLNGEAYIIPWHNTVTDRDGNKSKVHVAQLQIGYLGHMKLAWNSGLVSSIEADVVTIDEVEEGRFTYQRGTDGFLHHKPVGDRDLSERNIAFAYGMVWLKGSDRPVWRVIDKKQIERLRHTGQSANSPAWKKHYDEMCLAKILKRTLKWAPKSREQAIAIAVDDQADAGISQDFQRAQDIAGILPAETTKTAGQEMMEGAQKTTRGQGAAAGAEAESGHSVGASPQNEREPEKVLANRQKSPEEPKTGNLGW